MNTEDKTMTRDEARAVLLDWGIPESKLNAVQEMIELHRDLRLAKEALVEYRRLALLWRDWKELAYKFDHNGAMNATALVNRDTYLSWVKQTDHAEETYRTIIEAKK